MKKRTPTHQEVSSRVLRFIRENQLFSGNRRILVAVSGGADSVCLLQMLLGWHEELKLELHIAHLDHRLRGAESDADAAYVKRLAKRLGVTATIVSRDVKAYQKAHHLSVEEAAREVRYDFLSETAKAIQADCVVTGHTADDHIETILMHIVRGTGVRGLRGLQAVSRWQSKNHCLTIVRPLLPLRRQETLDYCRVRHLKPRQDSSNLSLSPLRNKIRHQLVPLLESYNPRIKEALIRMSRLTSEDITRLDHESATLLEEVARREDGTVIFDKQAFLSLPLPQRRNVAREAIAELLGSLKDIESRHIEDIVSAAGKPSGKKLNLPMGLTMATEYGRFLLVKDPAALTPPPPLKGKIPLHIPGETIIPGWRISASIIGRDEIDWNAGAFTAYLDIRKTGKNLAVRARKTGDRFQPLGMKHTKELAEFMIDAKIPRAWRSRIPLVCSEKQILWVGGWRLDERVKVTEATKQVLELKMEPQ